jgi:tRNA G26 N,N-dimethylase Trm1
VVLETHGGYGELFKLIYSDWEGCVIEKEPERTEFLARQRPTWRVYEGKAHELLGAGLFRDVAFDVVDVDPYGEPWPTIEAFFKTDRKLRPRMAIAVNDGLRQNARVKGSWKVNSLKEFARIYGNDKVRANYLEICQRKLTEIAGSAGYSVEWWHGYYCGNLDDMTHYGAVLSSSAAASESGTQIHA